MAQTTVSIELLRQFAQLLREECERFKQIKKAMDDALKSFLWEDPVSRKFQTNYEEQLQPLNNKLLPAMVKYENYLKDLAGLSDVYAENSSPSLEALKQGIAGKGITASDSPSLSAFRAAGIAAGVVGVGAAGVAVEQSITGDTFSDIAGGTNISTFKQGGYIYDGTDFSSIFKGIDLNPSAWDKKTKVEKWRVLQNLEKAIAKKEGRKPARIFIEGESSKLYPEKEEVLSEKKYGAYDKRFNKDEYSGKIILNKYFFKDINAEIKEEEKEIKLWKEEGHNENINLHANKIGKLYDMKKNMDFSIYQAVAITAHEGRHDYQYEEVFGQRNENYPQKYNKTQSSKMMQEFAMPDNYYASPGKRNMDKCFIIRDDTGKAVGKRLATPGNPAPEICDYNNYKYDNEIEKDAIPFGNWFKDFFKDYCKRTYK
jgi:hypothetical protein